MRLIVAVDPGKTTGYAVISYDGESPKLIETGEVQQLEFGQTIDRVLKAAGDSVVDVVCERFVINAQTIKNSQAPYSLEQIGILKHIVHMNGYDTEKIVFQSPSDAKKLFPNDALKKIQFWHVGGGGHAQDAMRHGLLRLAKTGWLPRMLLDR
jgi:hypothetical protein